MLSSKKVVVDTFPSKKVTRKQADLIQSPWLSNEIISEGKLRDALQLKSIKSRLPEDYNNYKKQRNKVNRMCRNAKQKKLKQDCDECKGDSAKMWKVVNKATDKKPKPNTYPNFIESRAADGDLIRVKDKTEIANAMNKQFAEMGGKLAEKLPATNAKFSDYMKNPSKSNVCISKKVLKQKLANYFMALMLTSV